MVQRKREGRDEMKSSQRYLKDGEKNGRLKKYSGDAGIKGLDNRKYLEEKGWKTSIQ